LVIVHLKQEWIALYGVNGSIAKFPSFDKVNELISSWNKGVYQALTANCQDYNSQILEALGYPAVKSLPMLAAHLRSIRSNATIPPMSMGKTVEAFLTTVSNLLEENDFSNIDYIYAALTYHIFTARNSGNDDEVAVLCNMLPRCYKRYFSSGLLPEHFIAYKPDENEKKSKKRKSSSRRRRKSNSRSRSRPKSETTVCASKPLPSADTPTSDAPPKKDD